MTIRSDLKMRDTFSDPVWLLDNLYARYKVFSLDYETFGTSHVGGGATIEAISAAINTSVVINSRGLIETTCFGLNSGDLTRYNIDYTKRLEILFSVLRYFTDAEVVARVQLKTVGTEGDLAALGLGLRIDNFTVLGEAYGTARQTVALGTLIDDRLWRVRIVLIPGNRVEFWVNGVLAGTLTGTAVPIGSGSARVVLSIINGATGGVNAFLYVSHITIVQEW